MAKIFVVDDEEDLGDLAKEMLERLGHSVTVAASGAAALEIFRQDPSAFDLIITDLNMPGVNGFEVFGTIREMRPDIPGILTTGNVGNNKSIEEKAFETGFVSIIWKPVSLEILRLAVERALSPPQPQR